ncbi:hypothetical protein [Streptomyces monomycini]|uniref:hypothetical protein n=1 Tax=Streptomyces monomycini TaxID=371720 RepID=UPI0004AB3FC4|nr:hypothetical protein [Streptomyces monomycini]
MSVRTIRPGARRELAEWWLLDCTLRYVVIFCAGWVATWVTLPMHVGEATEMRVQLERMSIGGVWAFLFFGLPSLLILVGLSARRTLREQDEFRVLTCLLFMIPMAPLLFSLRYGYAWFFLPAAQVVFAFAFLPLPTRCIVSWVEPGREKERARWAK